MKKQSLKLIIIGLLEAALILSTAYFQRLSAASANHPTTRLMHEDLKKEAFEILETRCNTCHRKQNPFMVFNEKNMAKRAPKIYKQVFVERRMPKGDDVRLTIEEYNALEKWLLTQNIY